MRLSLGSEYNWSWCLVLVVAVLHHDIHTRSLDVHKILLITISHQLTIQVRRKRLYIPARSLEANLPEN
jgi:hypothetical protein